MQSAQFRQSHGKIGDCEQSTIITMTSFHYTKNNGKYIQLHVGLTSLVLIKYKRNTRINTEMTKSTTISRMYTTHSLL